METMTIETKITITTDAIESMLVTALEGGSNYWYQINSKDLNDAKNWLESKIEVGLLNRNKSVHYIWMDAMFQGYPNSIPIYDTDEIHSLEDYDFEEVEPIGHLSMETIKKGLEKASVEYPIIFRQYFPEYKSGDADDADVLFQLICLDDIVYG